MHDSIVQTIDLNAPIARVWQAISDHQRFGEWFQVDLEAPFRVGGVSRGRVTHPGYEHLTWVAVVEALQPEELFAYTWWPGSDAGPSNTANPEKTRVEFKLEALSDSTRLTITESGFDNLPEERRAQAFAENSGGWEAQVQNIKTYVEG